MKLFKKDIIIFLGLLTLSFIIWQLILGNSAIDIQLHDTYFVLDKPSITILIIGPLTFLIFLARGLTRKFSSIGTNAGLIIGLIIIAFITHRIIELQKSYLNLMIGLVEEGQSDKGQFVEDVTNKISWTWGLFGLWTTALIFLAMRTVKIWKNG